MPCVVLWALVAVVLVGNNALLVRYCSEPMLPDDVSANAPELPPPGCDGRDVRKPADD